METPTPPPLWETIHGTGEKEQEQGSVHATKGGSFFLCGLGVGMGTPGSSQQSTVNTNDTNTNRVFLHCNPVPHRHLWYCFIDVTDFFVQTVFVKEKVTGQGFVSFKAQPSGTYSSNVTSGTKGFWAGTIHQEYFGIVGQALLETLVEFVDHLKREGI